MRRRALGPVVATALVALMGCSAQGRALGDDPFASGSDDRPSRIRIEVMNLNFNDARLYAIRDGGRITIGTVGGKQDGSFTLEWRYSQDLRIQIDLLAGPTCTTPRLQVEPGDILELQISSVFNQSSFCR